MAWTTPKTDWASPDIVVDNDLNEIGENLIDLHNGSGTFQTSAVVSANELPIDDTNKTYYITGSTNIQFIYVGNRVAGAEINLIFDISAGISLVTSTSTPSAGYGIITSAANITVAQWDAIKLVLINPTEWVPLFVS